MKLSMFPISSHRPTELRRKIQGGSGYQIPMPPTSKMSMKHFIKRTRVHLLQGHFPFSPRSARQVGVNAYSILPPAQHPNRTFTALLRVRGARPVLRVEDGTRDNTHISSSGGPRAPETAWGRPLGVGGGHGRGACVRGDKGSRVRVPLSRLTLRLWPQRGGSGPGSL